MLEFSSNDIFSRFAKDCEVIVEKSEEDTSVELSRGPSMPFLGELKISGVTPRPGTPTLGGEESARGEGEDVTMTTQEIIAIREKLRVDDELRTEEALIGLDIAQ